MPFVHFAYPEINEVHLLRISFHPEQDVLRLEVPVNNSFAMHFLDYRKYYQHKLNHRFEREFFQSFHLTRQVLPEKLDDHDIVFFFAASPIESRDAQSRSEEGDYFDLMVNRFHIIIILLFQLYRDIVFGNLIETMKNHPK